MILYFDCFSQLVKVFGSDGAQEVLNSVHSFIQGHSSKCCIALLLELCFHSYSARAMLFELCCKSYAVRAMVLVLCC